MLLFSCKGLCVGMEKWHIKEYIINIPPKAHGVFAVCSSSVRFPVMSTGNVLLVVADFTNTSEGLNASFTTATGRVCVCVCECVCVCVSVCACVCVRVCVCCIVLCY